MKKVMRIEYGDKRIKGEILWVLSGKSISQGISNVFDLKSKKSIRKEVFHKTKNMILNAKEYGIFEALNFDCEEAAFVELIKNLPNGFQLICCGTCRFGHACPIGGDKLMCLKDYPNISRKEDIISILEKSAQAFENNQDYKAFKIKNFICYCTNYIRASDEHYRYI